MKILKFLIFSLLFAVATTQIGCVTDPCAKTNCQNGGNCESGTCKCPAGYYGTNCEKGEVCRIATYTEQANPDPAVAHTLTYAPVGRLVSDISANKTISFTYSTGQIEQTTTYSGSADYQKIKYKLNALGYATTEYNEYSSGGNISRDTVQYKYTANNYFEGFEGRDYSITNTYANGNRVTQIYILDNAVYFTATYEYYTDKIQTNTYDGQYVPQFGTREKNMRKKYTQNYTDGTKVIYDYTYEYDTKGNVTQEIITTTNYNAAGTVTSTSTNTSNYTIACVQL